MKVAIANHGIFPDMVGGMEKHTYNLAKHLKEIGIDVHVLVPEREQMPPFPFPVHGLPWPKRPIWLWSNRAFTKHVGRWIDREKPDIAFGQGFNLWTYLKRKQVPCIFHPHGLEMYGVHLRGFEKWTALPFRKLVRYHGKHSDRTISLGGQLTTILKERAGIPASKIREIPNAVDLDEFPLSTGKRKPRSLLFVGRLAFNKGIDLLSQALDFCRDLDLMLTIVGDGPYREEVEKICHRDDRVEYARHLSGQALRDIYQQHEILLFTSRFEGMPTVVLEAMASGCAVIATRIGAVETMVSPETGLVVEPNANSIADGIRKMLKLSPKERAQLGKNGRRTVEDRFAWDRVIQQYKNLFEELL